MTKTIKTLLDGINKINTPLLILVCLSLNFLGFKLSGNEENYLALSKQFINPDWIPNSFFFSDVPGTRIIFQFIFGILLQYFSFEAITFFGRLLSFALFSIIFTKIFKYFNISNIELLFVLVIVFFKYQSIFAGGWMLGRFESKVIAYFFVLYSIYYFLKEKHLQALLFAGIAAYFHVLVGGWYAILYFIYLLITRIQFRQLLYYGFVYLIIIAPVIVYLYFNYFTNQPSVIEGINVNWVYVYFRNPHHIGIFKDYITFRKYFLDGVIISIVLFSTCIFYFTRIKDKDIKMLNTFNIIIFSQQFISMIIAIFDENGVFLKYYPFRTSVLSLFLMLLQITVYFKKYGNDIFFKKLISRIGYNNYKFYLNILFFLIIIPLLISKAHSNINRNILLSSSEKYGMKKRNELYSYIKDNTQKGDVFFLFAGKDDYLSFMRETEREQFSVFKFILTSNYKIYEWYIRVLEKQKVFEDINYIYKIKENYRIDYMVSKDPLPDKFYLVWSNKTFYLYKL